MMVKASGRSALILATGLFVCFAGPSPARQPAAIARPPRRNPTARRRANRSRHSARYWKRYAQRRSGKVGVEIHRDQEGRRQGRRRRRPATARPRSRRRSPTPMRSWRPPTPADSASAMTAKANTMLLAAADKPAEAQAHDRCGGFLRSAQRRRSGPATKPRHADRGDGRGQARRGGAGAGIKQRKLDLGPDLADRQDLHRLRRLADDGLRRAHVHGVR